jgi:hypothetical protein
MKEQEVLGRSNRLFSFDTTRTPQKTTRITLILLLRVFFVAGTCVPSRWLATRKRDTYRHTEGCMMYAAEMGSVAIIYTPSFVKISSGIQNLMEGIHKHTDSMVTL